MENPVFLKVTASCTQKKGGHCRAKTCRHGFVIAIFIATTPVGIIMSSRSIMLYLYNIITITTIISSSMIITIVVGTIVIVT